MKLDPLADTKLEYSASAGSRCIVSALCQRQVAAPGECEEWGLFLWLLEFPAVQVHDAGLSEV